MKSENYYWKKALTKLGVSTTGMKPVNYYLKKIYDILGGESTTKRKSDFYYLDYISENISGGGGSDIEVDWTNINKPLYQLITNVNIPSSVTSLGSGCFSGFNGLTSIEIPSSVTIIGDYCFTNCSGLTSVELSSSVTSLGSYCFYNCSGLTSIEIPSSVTSIGNNCFYGCTSITNYGLYWTETPVEYTSSKYALNTGTTFTIPKDTTAIYESANYPSANLVERTE